MRALILTLTLLASGGAHAADSVCALEPEARPATPEQAAQRKVDILADVIEFPRPQVVHLLGNTQLIRGGYRLYADELIYDKTSDIVEAKGAVRFYTPAGDTVRTSVLRYDVLADRAESGPAEYLMASRVTSVLGSGHDKVNAYGTADRVIFEGKNIMRLENADVITCLEGKDDMTFTADELTVDLDQGVRAAQRAKVQILVPERHERLRKMLDNFTN